ncbi:pirin-like protein isoform X2 [Setaria italica]|uniref:pirin-like protein isoform X2 n=1 Tax=Setaria italica TaxID=4555 RepID=UPI0006476596|nr:pirin-like protein isoform X2 [Setaria italica]XP_034574774.1 pirin-like protein isoform X2 [Setaria viridis]
MTTTMMRLRQHLASSPIYTSAIARIGNSRAPHRLLPVAPPQKHRPTTRVMSSSSSASDAAAAAVPFEKPRAVVKKLLAESQPEGQGATVRRSIGRHELRNLDPFLMLDEFSVSKPAGFPDHPHRGFETVTYMLEVRVLYSSKSCVTCLCPSAPRELFAQMSPSCAGLELQGAFTHQDFAGHKGTIRAGDVQWMTAGRGIVHSEMPAGDGVQKGLQLWINLSSKDKMIEPRYQELQSKDISRAEKDGVEVRIIAGEAFGVRSPVYTRTPTMYMDFTMRPGSQLHQPVPEGWNAFVYIIDGEGVFGREKSAPVSAHHCIVLGDGDGISVWNKSGAPLRFALVAGQPLGEPVVQHGPFVMNSRAEIQQAMEDYYYGKNGFERASQWSSSA